MAQIRQPFEAAQDRRSSGPRRASLRQQLLNGLQLNSVFLDGLGIRHLEPSQTIKDDLGND
jgi:hypothetical protein